MLHKWLCVFWECTEKTVLLYFMAVSEWESAHKYQECTGCSAWHRSMMSLSVELRYG